MNKELRKSVRLNTSACWWPSKMTGVTQPNWAGIISDLCAQRDTAAHAGRAGDVQAYNGLLADLKHAGVA